jgi:two-component system chemotaxis response regulator CheB
MIKVFIIDDSMLIRNMVKKLLKDQKDISIIGEAPNPVDAMVEFKKVGLPDVFILDIEMPKMDGLSFLKKLQSQRPIPTIIFATMVSHKSDKAIEAMALGACDVIVKPQNILESDNSELTNELVTKIKAAASSKSINHITIKEQEHNCDCEKSNKIIVIGASTGGVQTIESIMTHLKANHPPIVITQHMPQGFTSSFAHRLDKVCKNSTVKEAKNADLLECGMVVIAPGNLHLEIKKINNFQYQTQLKDYPKVSSHKPSVDVLFTSAAKEAKSHAVAFILTGMGKDGAQGIKKIKEAGGKTYGQDEQSCIVYGMPKVAFEIGGVEKQVTLDEIIDIINNTSEVK